MSRIPESDWKIIRKHKDRLLAEVCEQIFQKVESIAKLRNGKEYKKYIELWTLINNEDDSIAEMFDDLKRSNAIYRLAAMHSHGILTSEILNEFSDETRKNIELHTYGPC